MEKLINELHKLGFEISTKPKTVFTKLDVTHVKCGRTFIRDLATFKDTTKCPNCEVTATTAMKNIAGANKASSKAAYERLLTNERVLSGEYSVLSPAKDYQTNKIPIWFKHNTCGNEYETRPNSFTSGKSCPKCANIKRVKNTGHTPRDLEYVQKSIKELGKGKYILESEEYLGNKEYLTIYHKECSRSFSMRYNDFQQGYRCSHCAIELYQSKAEKEIAEILDEYGLEYKREVSFDGLKNKLNLRIDFVIYAEEGCLLLEYNGLQHYEKNWMSESDFEVRLLRDEIKKQYALDNDLPLEIISYATNNLRFSVLNILQDYGLI